MRGGDRGGAGHSRAVWIAAVGSVSAPAGQQWPAGFTATSPNPAKGQDGKGRAGTAAARDTPRPAPPLSSSKMSPVKGHHEPQDRRQAQAASEAPGVDVGATGLGGPREPGSSQGPGPRTARRQAAWEAAGGPGSCVLSVWVTSTASRALQCGIWAPGLDLLSEHGPTSSRVHGFMA